MNILIMYTPHSPSEGHLRRLQALDGVDSVAVATDVASAQRGARNATLILGHRYLRQVLPHARRLNWVQTTTQGVDRLPVEAMARKGVRLTRYTGSSPVVARHAVALAWSMTRRIPTAVRRQTRREWRKDADWLPAPDRAVVLGTGAIGRRIADLLQPHGVSVDGVKRSAEASLPAFDALYDRHTWREALPGRDWCLAALPHTPETRGMIDADALDALPADALFVNVGRGETVDLDALVDALEAGRLGGAALDTLPADREPLHASSPLWDVPNLVLTPHVGAYHPNRQERVEAFCERQVERYLQGRRLQNVVHPERVVGRVLEEA